MKGIFKWLTDAKAGTPLVAAVAGIVGPLLTRALGVDQAAVDGCVQVGRAAARVLSGS